jgi:hypothetical protein
LSSRAALPSSALAKGCNYTLTIWSRLIRFLDYPQLELSNNLAENAIRPIALGRKNWIHIGSKEAGPRVAAIVSIIETCRRLKIPIRFHPTGIPNSQPPDLLQQEVLLLTAELHITDSLAQILVAQNVSIPTAVTGRALVDTGASICAVDEAAAISLGLQPVGQSQVSGVGGPRHAMSMWVSFSSNKLNPDGSFRAWPRLRLRVCVWSAHPRR